MAAGDGPDDGWLLLLELDGASADAVLRRYTWGLDVAGLAGRMNSLAAAGGIGGLLAVQDAGASQDYVYFHDALGSVGQVLDLAAATAGAAMAAKYEYDPYGHQTGVAGTYDQPFRFSGKSHDAETGLGYWGYRYYNPVLGRWLNRDPLGELGGLNLYAYCGNGPAGAVDAFGLLSPEDCYRVHRILQAGCLQAAVACLGGAAGGFGGTLAACMTGYADGANLCESFRGNPSRFTDPEGKYTKLASGWNQGDDVVYQRFTWLWSSEPSDTFSVGRYYYHEGQKVVVYDDPFEEYAYVMSFEGVEQWSRGVHDYFDYRTFARKRGLRVDRTTGKVVRRSFSEDLALWLEDEVAAHTIDIDFLDPVVFFAGPAFTTLTAETAPGLIVEDTRTVSRLEYGLATGTTVLQVVPIAQLGTRSLGAGTGVAAELRLSGTAGQFARTRVWTFGNLPAGVLGATDEYGNIVIRSGLRGPLLRETVRHESVHRFFSPRSGPLLATRAQVGVSAYRHSHLIRYLEEALAEGYGTGSIRHGVILPLRADYGLNAWRIGAEGTIYIGGTAGGSYLLYSITDDAVQP